MGPGSKLVSTVKNTILSPIYTLLRGGGGGSKKPGAEHRDSDSDTTTVGALYLPAWCTRPRWQYTVDNGLRCSSSVALPAGQGRGNQRTRRLEGAECR